MKRSDKLMQKQQKIKLVLALNILVVIIEVIAGVYANSMALLSDAFHNLGDVAAVVIAFTAVVYAAKKPSDTMSFGFMRAEMMAAFVNALFLCVTMFFILFESTQKLLKPQGVDAPIVIVIALVALVANTISAFLLKESGLAHTHGEADECCAHEHEDANMAVAYWHMAGDAAISLGVALGGVAIWLWGIFWIDPLLSIVFSVFIIKEAYALLKKAFLSLMDANEQGSEHILEAIAEFDKVHSVHDLHLWRPNSKEVYCSAHIVLKENLTLEKIETLLEGIRTRLKKEGLTHINLQPESLKYATIQTVCESHNH